MQRNQGLHASQVDSWLELVANEPSPQARLRLFEAALHGLWTRLDPTLGEVTLSAIAERVLHNAAEKYPFFAALEIELPTGIKNAEKREQIGDVKDTELLAGMRFVVIELLTLLGNLTAEILTPELHAELDKAVAANPGRVVKGKRK